MNIIFWLSSLMTLFTNFTMITRPPPPPPCAHVYTYHDAGGTTYTVISGCAPSGVPTP